VLILLTVAIVLAIASRRLLARQPAQFALALGIVILGGIILEEATNRTLYRVRNFYGTLRVSRDATGVSHVLNYGTTLHGRQFIDALRSCEPLSYYHRTGPLAAVFAAFNTRPASPNIAVVGLGTGTTVGYAKPGQNWTFYEINPAVPAIAHDPRLFTYLQQCAAAPVEIVMGDARRQLQNAPAGHYGLIVLDAFNSDAIPVHLMTREAMELYLSKLAEGGLLAIHISNRHLNLASVVGDIANDAGLVGLDFDDKDKGARGKNASNWVVVARRRGDLGALVDSSSWEPLAGRSRAQIWTDDFSNILSVIDWN
jgi:spermidine synthase